VSLTQLVWTMHNICKVQGSNADNHKKKKNCETSINDTNNQNKRKQQQFI